MVRATTGKIGCIALPNLMLRLLGPGVSAFPIDIPVALSGSHNDSYGFVSVRAEREPSDWIEISPADNDDIESYVEDGRNRLNAMVVADIDRMNAILTPTMGEDSSGKKWQRIDVHTTKATWVHWEEFESSRQMSGSFTPIQHIVSSLPIGSIQHQQGSPKPQEPWKIQRNVDSTIWPEGPMVGIRLQQSKDYKPGEGKKTLPATNGVYDTWFNILDGVIIMRRAQGPINRIEMLSESPGKELQKANPPPVSHWSDLIWWQFHRLRTRSSLVSLKEQIDNLKLPGEAKIRVADVDVSNGKNLLHDWLNYVIVDAIPEIQNHITHPIIKRCLLSRNPGDDSIPEWPNHETFKVGHWCFYALLATDSSKPIAWLLAQHKDDKYLGHKVLGQVTITKGTWRSGLERKEFVNNPTLIWTVKPFEAAAINALRARENQWIHLQGATAYPPIADDPHWP